MTYHLGSQMLFIPLLIDALLVSAVYQLRGNRPWQIIFGTILVFHLLTAYIPLHITVMTIGGHFAEIVILCFMLVRAWYDMAPRGWFERFLNAAFGFGIGISSLTQGYAYMYDPLMQHVYKRQKGGHGYGDFDRIADSLHIGFSFVVWTWMIATLLAMIIPAILFIRRDLRQKSIFVMPSTDRHHT